MGLAVVGWRLQLGAGGRSWSILATRGLYKDQFIYLIIGTNCAYRISRKTVK